MKNVYLFLMMMMCTVCAFTGCSDEDDDAPVCPVTGVVLPKQAQKAGSEFQIAGNGFSSTCEIYLRAKQDVKVEVTERLTSAVTVMIPVTLTPGEYTVLLRQSGDWILGVLEVLEADAQCPVSDVVIPEGEIEVGSEVSIGGKGFGADAEVYLKLGDDSTKMTIAVAETGVSFTLPGDLAAGEYAVVLKQAGVWAIGKITVVAKAVPAMKVVSKITRIYYNKKGEQKIFYDLTYDETTGRILKIEESDAKGNRQYEKFVWGDNQLTVTIYMPDLDGNYTDEVSDGEYIYTLNDKGLVTNGKANTMFGEMTSAWGYDIAEEYLVKIGYGDNDESGTSEFTMDGNKLSKFIYSSYGMNVDFSYEGEKAAPENKANLDLIAYILDAGLYLNDFEQFYARLAGICGEKPAFLPFNLKAEESGINQDCIYTTDGDGFVTEITFPEEGEEPVRYVVEYK